MMISQCTMLHGFVVPKLPSPLVADLQEASTAQGNGYPNLLTHRRLAVKSIHIYVYLLLAMLAVEAHQKYPMYLYSREA